MDTGAPVGSAPGRLRMAKLKRFKVDPRVPVLIVGGGINGAGTFRDLAAQGVDCLLVDKGDWCSGTSAAPSRLIHGGLKYLETGEVRLVAESAHERNLLLRNAPHLVKPLATVVPIRSYVGGIWPAMNRFIGRKAKLADRGLLILEAGLAFYDWLGRKGRVMPRHSIALRAAALRRFPDLDPKIVATATYYDARVTQAERLCAELVADGEAAHPGALALNYVALTGAASGRVTLRDVVTGKTVEVAPELVINAAGPWIDLVNRAVGLNKTYVGGTKGSHVLVEHPALVRQLDGHMIYFGSADGRICLVYPFFGRALIGATDLKADNPDECVCDQAEVDYLLARVNELFPRLGITADQIVYRYAGIRPLPASDAEDPGQISRDHAIRRDTVPGSAIPVLSLVGGKWTTFRAFAAQTTDAALAQLGRTRCRSTAAEPIGGGRDYPSTTTALNEHVARLAKALGVDGGRAATLFDRYGTSAETLLTCDPGHDAPLTNVPNYSTREVRAVAIREHVVTLGDLVFRRTPIAVSENLTTAALQEVAAVMAPVLDWNGTECARQVATTITFAQNRHGLRFG